MNEEMLDMTQEQEEAFEEEAIDSTEELCKLRTELFCIKNNVPKGIWEDITILAEHMMSKNSNTTFDDAMSESYKRLSESFVPHVNTGVKFNSVKSDDMSALRRAFKLV